MRRWISVWITIYLVGTSLLGDVIHFNNGASVSGKIVRQSVDSVTILTNGIETTYAKKDIKSISQGENISAPPPPPASSSQNTQPSQEPSPQSSTESTETTQQNQTQTTSHTPNLVGPAGATGVIRRHERRQRRRGGATIQPID